MHNYQTSNKRSLFRFNRNIRCGWEVEPNKKGDSEESESPLDFTLKPKSLQGWILDDKVVVSASKSLISTMNWLTRSHSPNCTATGSIWARVDVL